MKSKEEQRLQRRAPCIRLICIGRSKLQLRFWGAVGLGHVSYHGLALISWQRRKTAGLWQLKFMCATDPAYKLAGSFCGFCGSRTLTRLDRITNVRSCLYSAPRLALGLCFYDSGCFSVPSSSKTHSVQKCPSSCYIHTDVSAEHDLNIKSVWRAGSGGGVELVLNNKQNELDCTSSPVWGQISIKSNHFLGATVVQLVSQMSTNPRAGRLTLTSPAYATDPEPFGAYNAAVRPQEFAQRQSVFIIVENLGHGLFQLPKSVKLWSNCKIVIFRNVIAELICVFFQIVQDQRSAWWVGWSKHMKGDLCMFDGSVYVGMMQPVSLNSWSHKTESPWASNTEGQPCFETWQVRMWSKCHTVRRRQSGAEPLNIKPCFWGTEHTESRPVYFYNASIYVAFVSIITACTMKRVKFTYKRILLVQLCALFSSLQALML